MTKHEFLLALSEKLAALPERDIECSIDYYSESIDDRMEDGLSEEEAVAMLGSVDAIAEDILSDPSISEYTPRSRGLNKRQKTDMCTSADELSKGKARKYAPRAWNVILLVLGSPVWLPLLLAFLVVILSLFVVIWAIVISIYSAPLALIGSAVLGVSAAFPLAFSGSTSEGMFTVGIGLFSGGLAILFFHACLYATMGAAFLTKMIWRGILRCIRWRK